MVRNFFLNRTSMANRLSTGIDVDWEYPVQRGNDPPRKEDRENFVLLLQEMRRVLAPAGKLLAIAVGATRKIGDISYDIPGIVRHVDFINLMSYDYHGSWSNRTGINSPLFSHDELSVDASVRYWLSEGCPRSMLIVGIPNYGRTFTLENPNQKGVGALASGAGVAGQWTQEEGMLGYNEILANRWPEQWEDYQRVPYAVQGNQWVGYDNPRSAQEKANYVIGNRLGGCMFWSIETDDFRRGNPIMSVVSKLMRGRSINDIKASNYETKPLPEED